MKGKILLGVVGGIFIGLGVGTIALGFVKYKL